MNRRPTHLSVLAGLLAASTAAVCLVPAAASAATTSTTTLNAASAPTVGVAVKYAATVKPAPTAGTVRFAVNGTTVAGCAAVAVASGKAICRITFRSTTPVRVGAQFSGGSGVATSSTTQNVQPTDGVQGQIVGNTGTCTTAAGALVAVSYGAWGGPVVRGCDPKPTTGIKLLTTAGFTTTGTQHDGPQFLCRIGHPYWKSGTQYPTPATEACVNTPPANAYWSYWIAPRGQNTWNYSPLGAYSDVPTAGGAEAWTFGETDIAGSTGQPSFTPNQVRAGLPAA